MQERTYMYRIYPTVKEQKNFESIADTVRALYNMMLRERTKHYRESGVWKRLDPTPFVKESLLMRDLDPTIIAHTVTKLIKAYEAFFRMQRTKECRYRPEALQKRAEDPSYELMDNDRVGYPRAKHKTSKESWDIGTENVMAANGRINIPGVGNVKLRLHRPIPQNAKILFYTLLKKPTGHFFLLVHLQMPDAKKSTTLPEAALGIALEPARLAQRSDGVPTTFHRASQGQERRIKKAYEVLCRKVPGSRQYEKQRLYLAGIYEKRSNQRRDSLHKISRAIVNSVDCLAIEEPMVMRKKKRLQQKGVFSMVTDEAWWTFSEYLRYKCREAGKWFWRAPGDVPVRTACSACGIIAEKYKEDTQWICPQCGMAMRSSLNAARNLEMFGMLQIEQQKQLKQQGE